MRPIEQTIIECITKKNTYCFQLWDHTSQRIGLAQTEY